MEKNLSLKGQHRQVNLVIVVAPVTDLVVGVVMQADVAVATGAVSASLEGDQTAAEVVGRETAVVLDGQTAAVAMAVAVIDIVEIVVAATVDTTEEDVATVAMMTVEDDRSY